MGRSQVKMCGANQIKIVPIFLACVCLFLGVTTGQAQVGSESLIELDSGQDTGSSQVADQNDQPNLPQSTVDMGLGMPTAEPPPGTPSFLGGGLFFGQGAEDQSNGGSSGGLSSTTRLAGHADLLKFWHRSVTSLDYAGSGIFYGGGNSEQIQALSANQRFLWRRGQLTLTDILSNSPTGGFGSASFGGAGLYSTVFAGTGAATQAGVALGDFFGANGLGGVGQSAQLTNLSLVSVAQALTPRSVVAVGGGYGFTNFFNNTNNLINSTQVSALARYSYLLSHKSAIGVVYGYRSFHFPVASEGHLNTHLVELVYQRQLSSRLGFTAAAGPQFSESIRTYSLSSLLGGILGTFSFTAKTSQINTAAFASLGYRLRRAAMLLSYNRLVTSGSGLVAGANTDVVRFSVGRPLSRVWDASFNAGYVHQVSVGKALFSTPNQTYNNGYAGVGVRRVFGRHVSAVASYQFNGASGTAVCADTSVCGGVLQRHTFLVGVSWGFRPIRLDHGGKDNAVDDSDRSGKGDSDSLIKPDIDN